MLHLLAIGLSQFGQTNDQIARARCLVNLLLLVDTELARTAVDQEKETADDGEDLEEVVLGKVLVGMMVMEL